ncbi:hypothetical protein BpHYR1_045538 [Brachionus plicatilis]|uniref:Uncharacterized protein n=1 Tax=Brachionus plicatilis TaxID=10195 RepID=A0A3M7SDI9_BRAPC|nr:hypothetical protein BpHYR1_045538 [Brachionus plicatilis]
MPQVERSGFFGYVIVQVGCVVVCFVSVIVHWKYLDVFFVVRPKILISNDKPLKNKFSKCFFYFPKPDKKLVNIINYSVGIGTSRYLTGQKFSETVTVSALADSKKSNEVEKETEKKAKAILN